MEFIDKQELLNKICFNGLVHKRINKKLNTMWSMDEIEAFILKLINETEYNCIEKIGKNIYVINQEHHILITINGKTFSVITVDKVS